MSVDWLDSRLAQDGAWVDTNPDRRLQSTRAAQAPPPPFIHAPVPTNHGWRLNDRMERTWLVQRAFSDHCIGRSISTRAAYVFPQSGVERWVAEHQSGAKFVQGMMGVVEHQSGASASTHHPRNPRPYRRSALRGLLRMYFRIVSNSVLL